MKIVGVTPIKLNNVRIPGKNIRPLSDGTPLVHLIQKAALEADEFDEYCIYCSNPEIKSYLLDGVRYIKRDEKYDTPEADVLQMMRDFSNIIDADIYIQIHATAPFLSPDTIKTVVKMMREGVYDSVLTVRRMQDFLWTDGHPANYTSDFIPRTQDMKPWFAETTGLYAYTKDVIRKLHRRVGDRPYLLEVSEIEAIDINNPIDFEIADAVYTCILNSGPGGGV